MLPFVTAFSPAYQAGWFHEELCTTLDAFIQGVERKQSPRLIIEVPPRHGKSQIISRCFPPFVLGRHPEWEVVTATYGQELADTFGKYVRTILNSSEYQDLFPRTVVDTSTNSANQVGIVPHGSYLAVGVGGALTGRGAHCLIIDDPVKDRAQADSERFRTAVWDWYSSTARTRLAPGAGIIILQTRWHEDDLAGQLQRRAKEDADAEQWMVITYPAIATVPELHRAPGEALHPERYDVRELELIKASIAPRDWSALYQQRPVPDDGVFFSRDMIDKSLYHPVKELPSIADLAVYISCDLAISEATTADYTVIIPAGVDRTGKIWVLETYVRARLDAFAIVNTVLDLVQRYKARAIIMERGHISKSIGPLLRKCMAERRIFPMIFDPVPNQDKKSRAASIQGRMAQGMVKIPNTVRVQTELIPELLAFPASQHDDAVDALAWLGLHLDAMPHGRVALKPAAPKTPTEGSAEWYERQTATRRLAPSGRFGRTMKHLNGRLFGG